MIREPDVDGLRIPAATYTVFGVLQAAVLLRYRGEVDAAEPATWVYAALLLVVVGTGGYGWRVVRRGPR